MVDLIFIALLACMFYGIWSFARDLFDVIKLLMPKKRRRK